MTGPARAVVDADAVTAILLDVAEHIERNSADTAAAAATVRRVALHVLHQGDQLTRPPAPPVEPSAVPHEPAALGRRWAIYQAGVIKARGTAWTAAGARRAARNEADALDRWAKLRQRLRP